MEEILKLEHVSASYGDKQVLNDLTLAFPRGKITAVLGPSGSGKSTLLRCINRLIEEEADGSFTGSILENGQDLKNMPVAQLRRKIGMVFQTPAPFPFSIYKNMTYALKYMGVRKKSELNAVVEEKLKMAGLWDEIKDELQKPATSLSGGQQQRLCIARALTANPEILLLDEPCSALDVKSTAAVEDMLQGLTGSLSIILVTHNLGQARRIADRVLYLQDGKAVEYTDKETFFTNPSTPEAKDFLSGVIG